MSYFDEDFFDYLGSPLSPRATGSSGAVQAEFTALATPRAVSPRRSLRAGSVNWDPKEYLLDIATSRRSSGDVPKPHALKSPLLATSPVDNDVDDAYGMLDGLYWRSPTDDKIAEPAESGGADTPLHTTYGSPTVGNGLPKPRASPRRAASVSSPGDDAAWSTWDAYMLPMSIGSPRTASPSPAAAAMTDEEDAALEEAYFADMMPMLIECGEAMQRHRQRDRNARASNGGNGRDHDSTQRVFTGFLPPNMSPPSVTTRQERVSPGLTDAESHNTPATSPQTRAHLSWHLLSLSGSDSDVETDAKTVSTTAHRQERQWLAGYEGGAFYMSPDPPEPWSHIPAPPPPPQTAKAAATATKKAAERATFPPPLPLPKEDAPDVQQSLPMWMVPGLSSPLHMPTHTTSATHAGARRPSKLGGKAPAVVRRSVRMAAVEDEPETEMVDLDADPTRIATAHQPHQSYGDPASDRTANAHVRRGKNGKRSASTSRASRSGRADCGPKSMTTTPTTAMDDALQPPRLQTVLVMLRDVVPSNVVMDQSLFQSYAHYTEAGLLVCQELAEVAQQLVAGESAASLILHGASAFTDVTGVAGRVSQGLLGELSSFFSLFFEDLGRYTAQVTANTFCVQASVVLLKQDMYRDLLKMGTPDEYSPLLVSGTPLLGPRLSGATLQPLTSCAGTMDVLRRAMGRLIGDDLDAGAVLVSVYIKQKTTRASAGTGSRNKRNHPSYHDDVLLSSYSAVISTPQALHVMTATDLYPLTKGLIHRCFRGALSPSLFASLYEMPPEEQQLTKELTKTLYEQVHTSPPHEGSVTQLLSSIHRQARVFHKMLSTARADSDAARSAWNKECDTVSESREARTKARGKTKPVPSTKPENTRLSKLYKAYQRRHRRWLRLDFLLRSLAGIAADCEATLRSPIDSLPPVYLVTTHYLRQSSSEARSQCGSAWRFMSNAVPESARNVRFASNQPLFASDSEDDEEYVPANTPVGKYNLVYPFPFRQPRAGQPRSLGEPDIPPLVQSASVNLFSGGYSCATLGIRPLLDPADASLRRFFRLPVDARKARRQSALSCMQLPTVTSPQMDSVVLLDSRDAPLTMTAESDTVERHCVRNAGGGDVQAGRLGDDVHTFNVDEVCARSGGDGGDGGDGGGSSRFSSSGSGDFQQSSEPPVSSLLTKALTSFASGYNAHVYYAVVCESNATDRLARLQRTPLWAHLELMVNAVLADAGTTPVHNRYSTASSSRRRRSSAPRSTPTLFMSACHITGVDLVEDDLTSHDKDDPSVVPLAPFRAAWTPAGPVVEGCPYVQVASAEALDERMATLMTNLERACQRGRDVHMRLSFILHDRQVTARDTDVNLSALTVWLTSNPMLFTSLGVPSSVVFSHKLNLLRPHYCQSVVYVTDLPLHATNPDACTAALRRQADLCQNMCIPLFPCQWSLRAYLGYLSDRQTAFRVATMALQEAEAATVRPNKASTSSLTHGRHGNLLPYGAPTYNADNPVTCDNGVRARDLLDACGVLERMRGLVIRALTPQASAGGATTGVGALTTPRRASLVSSSVLMSNTALSGAGGAAVAAAAAAEPPQCDILLALLSDGSGLYNITAPPPMSFTRAPLTRSPGEADRSPSTAGTTTTTTTTETNRLQTVTTTTTIRSADDMRRTSSELERKMTPLPLSTSNSPSFYSSDMTSRLSVPLSECQTGKGTVTPVPPTAPPHRVTPHRPRQTNSHALNSDTTGNSSARSTLPQVSLTSTPTSLSPSKARPASQTAVFETTSSIASHHQPVTRLSGSAQVSSRDTFSRMATPASYTSNSPPPPPATTADGVRRTTTAPDMTRTQNHTTTLPLRTAASTSTSARHLHSSLNSRVAAPAEKLHSSVPALPYTVANEAALPPPGRRGLAGMSSATL